MQEKSLDQIYPIVPFDPLSTPKPKQWLIEHLWQKGKVNGVAGAEKSGKSRLLGWLIVGMYSPMVLGLNCSASHERVLYLAAEEQIGDVEERLISYSKLQGLNPAVLDISFIEAMGMRLDLKDQRRWLEEQLLKGGFTTLIIDPLIRVHGAKESDNTEMSVVLTALRRWATKFGITIIILHHTPKPNVDTDLTRMANWFRGASDIAAVVDTAQYLGRVTKTSILMMRQGRQPPLADIMIDDLGDANGFHVGTRKGK